MLRRNPPPDLATDAEITAVALHAHRLNGGCVTGFSSPTQLIFEKQAKNTVKEQLLRRELSGDQVVILHNRRAGQREAVSKVDQLVATLREHEFRPLICGSAEELSAVEFDGTIRCVICAGGDGTVNAALEAVGRRAPLLPYPLGNENLLAKYLSVEPHPAACLDRLRAGAAVDFDSGQFSCVDDQRHSGVFLLMLSCGLDAEVVERVHRHRTGHISQWNYVRQTLAALREYPFADIEVEWVDDAGQRQGAEGNWVFVFNFPSYARGLGIAPDADPQDGCFDVCVLQGRSITRNLGHLATILSGSHGEWSGCQRLRTRRLRLASQGPLPIQIDGDPGGQTTVDVHIVPRGMQLVVGPLA